MDTHVFGRIVALEAEAPGFLAELLVEFENGVVQRLAAMRKAHGAHDDEALVFAAHAMRGSCGTVGAMRMAALAHRLEYGRPTRAEGGALVRRLQAEWSDVRRAVAAALADRVLAA